MGQRLLFVILIAAISLPRLGRGAEPILLRGAGWSLRVNPDRLRAEVVSDSGTTVLISEGQEGLGTAGGIEATGMGARWTLAAKGLLVEARVEGGGFSMAFKSDRAGEFRWPDVVPGAAVEGFVLPRGEGNWVPAGDEEWIHWLAGDPENSSAINEEFSMPFFGFRTREATVTCVLTNPFNSDLSYSRRGGRLGFRITHAFTRLDAEKTYGLVIRMGGPSPVEPARQYRAWLAASGGFVSLADKIREVPRAGRLPGALHAYLWGLPFEIGDVKDWGGFSRRLAGLPSAPPDSPSARLWSRLPQAGQKAVRNLLADQFKDDYLKSEVTRAFSDLIAQGVVSPGQMREVFPAELAPESDWGDGISVKFLKMLSAAGIDRACLILNDLNSGDRCPEVARLADEMGYLYGPYDTYGSIFKPGEADSWDTAKFDQELYETGGIVREDGALRHGFAGRGRELSSVAARPWVEKRVTAKMKVAPFSGWFVDCDAAGQYFDNYSTRFPHTQAQDLAARLDRMRWIARTYGLPIGSENGVGLAAGAIHFAHGMLTPAIGSWDDPDLGDNKSQYNLGAWWPPEHPDAFFKRVPIKPKFRRMFCDPRFRLPLYQVVFHDSVITTHHWLTHSLKFRGTVATLALLEQLYNVPPLYHFTVAEFTKWKSRILPHFMFFSPLHRRLALQPMTDFAWLTEDRLVQKTAFGDGTEIVANFSAGRATVEGLTIPPGTVIARQNGVTTSYTPTEP